MIEHLETLDKKARSIAISPEQINSWNSNPKTQQLRLGIEHSIISEHLNLRDFSDDPMKLNYHKGCIEMLENLQEAMEVKDD